MKEKVLDCQCGSCNVEVDWDDEGLPDEYLLTKEYLKLMTKKYSMM